MTILFGWNRFRLKSFTFQELNLPELEQFPNATFQVAQSYFHLFYIPVFPMGKRYDLVMNKQLYHVPPSIMKMVNPDQIKVRGKWYAWSLPILVLLIMLGLKINNAVKKSQDEAYAIELAQWDLKFFDNPAVGDHIWFNDGDQVNFDAEVFKLEENRVILFVNLMNKLDKELMKSALNGDAEVDADSMMVLINDRDELVTSSAFNDSLYEEHPDLPVFRKVLMFQLEEYPIDYEFVKMSLKDYKALKKSLGDGYTKKAKKIRVPAFHEITDQPLFVNPD
ncbi:hypothetical protein [Fluviicola chungangensis]|uniref:Uncharacterized protein n=1 Tax=Fluviicola chungangensis TaxID=2597671 RepID=A0A556N7B1_9FLAO|nr:hypothetical protein [Fluviicola chungangensis]TSJ48010.1 hypothetical protein FO442_02450 [Fluviicola chungangensis]